MKKTTLFLAVTGLLLISSGNIYSQTNKENKTSKEEKTEIKATKKPGEPVKGAEVFEENAKRNNAESGKAEKEEKAEAKKPAKAKKPTKAKKEKNIKEEKK